MTAPTKEETEPTTRTTQADVTQEPTSHYAQPWWIVGEEREVAGRTVRHGAFSTTRRLFPHWHRMECPDCGHSWTIEAFTYHELLGVSCPVCHKTGWQLVKAGPVQEVEKEGREEPKA